MNNKIRILHIDDDHSDLQLIKEILHEFDIVEADNRQKFELLLSENNFDLVLSDFNILGFDGLQVLQLVKAKFPKTPVIMVTGKGSEEIAVQAIKMGATDYVTKSVKHLQDLGTTIRKVLENKKLQDEQILTLLALRKSEEKYRKFFENVRDMFFQIDAQGFVSEISPSIFKVAGYLPEEVIGTPAVNFFHSLEERETLLEIIDKQGEVSDVEVCLKIKSGEIRYASLNAYKLFDHEGIQIGLEGSLRDITRRKQSELALEKNNLFLKTLLNAIPAPVFYKDKEGRYAGVNKFYEVFFGKTNQELIGKTVFDVNPRELADIYYEKDMELFQNPGVQVYESQKKDIMGVFHDVVCHKATFMDTNGHVNGLIGVILDITERKIAEEKLQFKNAILSTQQEVSIDGILVVDENSHIVSYNHRFVEMWGLPPELVEMKADEPVLRFVTNKVADSRSFLQRVQYLYEHKRETSRDEIVLMDGRTFDRYSAPMFSNQEKYYGRVWNFRDITERKQAEEIIAKERTLLKTLIDNLPSAIFVKDKDYRKIIANALHKSCMAAHLSSLGLDPATEIIGKTDFEIISKEYAKKYFTDDQKVIRDGLTIINKEEKGVSPDGEKIYLLVSKIPLRDKDGMVNGMVGITTDITKNKQAEILLREKAQEIEAQNEELLRTNEELYHAKEKAEESDRLKTAFLQNMSHEIRTPMNGIMGFTQLLKMPDISSEDQKNFIRFIEQSSKRMLNIINDIIDLSKIEAGQIHLSYKKISVNHLIKQIYVSFKSEAEKNGISLMFYTELSDELCIIETDDSKLIQVLKNLLKNALKFTKTGTISFGYKIVDTLHATPLLEFYVQDTGKGIPENQKDIIFERFIQGDMAAARNYDGAGLGLSIAKAYVEKLGGKIWVESELDKGATFFFHIPYKLVNIGLNQLETK